MDIEKNEMLTVLGFMSGTSLDGVDAAVVTTNGQNYLETLDFISVPYPEKVKQAVRAAFGKTKPDETTREAERLVTDVYSTIAKQLVKMHDIELIGLHGQSITHIPEKQFTWQLGDGDRLSLEANCPVVYNFRKADMEAGGQGAPFIPVYHQVLAERVPEDVVVILNIGGVSNLTYIDKTTDTLIGFDTGTGNAMIDDWVTSRTDMLCDEDGVMASIGKIDQARVDIWLKNPFFAQDYPKSLDRNPFAEVSVADMGTSDGVATLTSFTARGIAKNLELLPKQPEKVYVCGGGRHNPTMMAMISEASGLEVLDIGELGVNGDAVEAEGFAYMAVRSLKKLPISFPSTTGCIEPMTGGVFVNNASEVSEDEDNVRFG